MEQTPKDVAIDTAIDFRRKHAEMEAILALLSKPTEPLSLQELAARTVLQKKIPYSLETVPFTVYNFLRGDDYYQCLRMI